MNTRGNKTRARAKRLVARIKNVKHHQFKLSTVVISGIVVLIVGIGIGGSTNVWDRSLKIVGIRPDIPTLDFSSLETTYEQLAANYDGTVDRSKILDGAKHGLVSALGDPYSVYFNADEAKSFSSDLSGSFSGIGAALALKDSAVTVSSALKGSPA